MVVKMAASNTYSVNELPTDNNTALTVDKEGQATRVTQRKFDIVTTQPGYDSLIVERDCQQLGLLPSPLSPHPFNAYMSANSIKTVRKTPIYYETTVGYFAPLSTIDQSGDHLPHDPTLDAAVLSFTSQKGEEEVDSGSFGDNDFTHPFTTILGEPLGTATRTTVDLVMTVKKNMLVFNPLNIWLYVDAVNADTFLGFGPEQVLCVDMSGEQQLVTGSSGFTYWSVQAQFAFRQTAPNAGFEYGWGTRLLHQGIYYLVDDGNGGTKRTRDRDSDGIINPNPVALDEDGYKLPDGAPYNYRYWLLHRKVSFAGLGLGI